MGKIKGKLIKRTANTLLKEGIEFTGSFDKNKKILGNTMPSRKIRNQLAGFLSRAKKKEKQEQLKMLKESKK